MPSSIDFLPRPWDADTVQPVSPDPRLEAARRPPLRDVAVIVLPGCAPFELGVVCEVFGTDRTDMGVPKIAFDLVAEVPGAVATSLGFDVVVHAGLERAATADLVVVPASPYDAPASEAVVALLHAAIARGARVLSVCSGAFVLADAGLLDGRRCTTHWMHAEELAQRVPSATVLPDVLYVEDGPVMTSAGTAAGIDASLHLVRQSFGAAVVATIARRMVVPPHRDGGQAQYVETPMPQLDCETMEPLLSWMVEHLDEELTVEDLSAQAHLAPRTFARRFRAETGSTPHVWLTQQRLNLAERLLEDSDESVDRVAALSGFGTAAQMRHHFTRRRGTTPQAYRRTFRRADISA
jgi:transcriptional regulator GlxA family with amidase domain